MKVVFSGLGRLHKSHSNLTTLYTSALPFFRRLHNDDKMFGRKFTGKGKENAIQCQNKYKEDIHKNKNRMQVLPIKIMDKRTSSV